MIKYADELISDFLKNEIKNMIPKLLKKEKEFLINRVYPNGIYPDNENELKSILNLILRTINKNYK